MDALVDFILNISIWGVAKALVVFALLIYLVFAIVVLRQVYLMAKVVSGRADFLVKVFAWAHLFFVVFVIFLALVIL